MKKIVLIFFAIAVFAPVSISAQSTAANKAWAPFFTKFKAALKSRNKARVKALMASHRNFFYGGGYEASRDEYLQRTMPFLLREANRGVQNYNQTGKPGRITRPGVHGSLVFEYIGGRWLFTAIMGD
jgi:hypothetical protein